MTLTMFYSKMELSSFFSALWSSIDRYFQMVGYSRAAAELARMGYQEQSKHCIMQIAKIQNDK